MQAPSKLRRTSRWALLPAIVLTAIVAGLPAAYAWDQQATDAEMSTELSYRAYQGLPQHHSSGAYASANPRERGFGQLDTGGLAGLQVSRDTHNWL